MSLLRRASSPIRNFGKEKNALLFEVIFHHLELEGVYQDRYNRQKCWVKWIRTSKEGQTKKKVTISDGRADFMMERVPIECTCHYTHETGYEPKILNIELYTRSSKDKTVMIGAFEFDLTTYALQESNPDLAFPVKNEDGKKIGDLTVAINCSFIEGKGSQPRGARLNSPRRPNGESPSRSLNSSPSPSPQFGMAEPTGTPRSSAAQSAHRRAARDDVLDAEPVTESSRSDSSAFPKSPQTASGKLVARIYFSNGTYTSTVVKPNQTAAFISNQVRKRRAAGGTTTLPDGEVLEEMRLFEGAVEGKMIRQLQDDEFVAKVMSRWPEEEDAFLIFMMPTHSVEVGTEITSLDELDEEETETATIADEEEFDEEEFDEEEHDEEDEEETGEKLGFDGLPVIDGQHPADEDDDEEEYDDEDDYEDEVQEDEVQHREEEEPEEEPEDERSQDTATELEETKKQSAVLKKESARKDAEMEALRRELDLMREQTNKQLGNQEVLDNREAKPSQAKKGACGGCVIA